MEETDADNPRWMASRASFDTNRPAVRAAAAPGRASVDHHHHHHHRDQVKTLEVDTGRPFSYATPRRGSASPMRNHSPATPSPGKARPPIQVRSASPRVADRTGTATGSYTPSLLHSQRCHVPNYMAATESAKARARSQSAPRQRPATPERDRAGAKKRLSYPAPPVADPYGYAGSLRSPSFKSAAGRFSSDHRSTVSSSCADSLADAVVSPSSTTDLRRWLR